jgi:hypothetical protein
MPGCFSDTASKVGAKPRQGAHQGAQKSMITLAFSLMVCWKLSALSSSVAMSGSLVEVDECYRFGA